MLILHYWLKIMMTQQEQEASRVDERDGKLAKGKQAYY